eukprot:2479068-Amphidinium_carterae.1
METIFVLDFVFLAGVDVVEGVMSAPCSHHKQMEHSKKEKARTRGDLPQLNLPKCRKNVGNGREMTKLTKLLE